MPFDVVSNMTDVDAIFKALAHPFRREVLLWLADIEEYFPDYEHLFSGSIPANAVGARSNLSQSTVSMHIAQLERSGLVTVRRIGQWTLLSRNEETIRKFANWIDANLLGSQGSGI
ncbi:ArsR/SmtB family transcription factor [Paraburkholderia sp. BCC1885]|uniref:ArsR/SmtB family transcription factor n=1 Tax=Paraburkholderia sp. BCC1885 TaxID=2562669 RepID=UPI0021B1F279|nr:helix-turn-helix transcriptional regulator [Paraburkholderia sp. BCC1885]